jgi:hypothetical protein
MPPRLRKLESGFLPALVREARDYASRYAPFKDRLDDAHGRIALLVPLVTEPAAPGHGDPHIRDATLARAADRGWAVVDVLAVICAICGLLNRYQEEEIRSSLT